MQISWVATAAGRPNYLQETIRSWQECKEWAGLTKTWFVEPGPIASVDEQLIREAGAMPFVNERRMGPLSNPWRALSHGFDTHHSDFVILAEDDAIAYPDTIDYFKWAAEKFEDDDQVMFVCAFQKKKYTEGQVVDYLRSAVYVPGYFAPTIWGTWKSRWYGSSGLMATWDHDYSHNGWDWNFTRRILPQANAGSIVPIYSRSQHIGRYGGAHCTPELFDELQAPVPVWAQSDKPWTLEEDA